MESLLFNPHPIALDKNGNVTKQYKKYKPLFDSLQGSILKEHGRDYTVHMALQFDKPTVKPAEIKRVIATFSKLVTSATKQHQDSAKYRRWLECHCVDAYPSEIFINFLLTARGYRKLGIADVPSDPSFRLGMKEEREWKEAFPEWGHSLTASNIVALRSAKEKDRKAYFQQQLLKAKAKQVKAAQLTTEEPWQGYLEEGIDAMIILAADNRQTDGTMQADTIVPNRFPEDLNAKAKEIEAMFSPVATVLAEYEHGITYYNKDDARKQLGDDDRRPIEHFGFIDGISNPLFVENEVQPVKVNEPVEAYGRYDPWAPLHLALAKDPNGEPHEYGSYLVFMKLEQNVQAFKASVGKLAKRLNISTDLAEAFVVGRFRDGTPVALSSRNGNYPIQNNFDYRDDHGASDVEGLRCPLHAHTRKVNRRDSYRETRIVRRGLTYGYRNYHYDDKSGYLQFDDEPTGGVGLLFMCFQRDIERQFGSIMNDWASQNSPQYGAGYDPIIGQIARVTRVEDTQRWRDRWGPSLDARIDSLSFPNAAPFQTFITVKCGEYFFAPSLGFLKNITKF